MHQAHLFPCAPVPPLLHHHFLLLSLLLLLFLLLGRGIQVCWEEPLARGLDALSAQLLVTARRRDQGGIHSQVLPSAGPDCARGLPSVNPLAHWSFEDCLDYAAKYRIPVHPLLAHGFPAVGDAHSTAPVPQDESVAFVDYHLVGRREVRVDSYLVSLYCFLEFAEASLLSVSRAVCIHVSQHTHQHPARQRPTLIVPLSFHAD